MISNRSVPTINDPKVNALLLASKAQIPCILLGGQYFARDMCFVGSIAEQYANDVNVDVAFFSALGLSKDGIISDTDTDIEQTTIRKIIMTHSKKNIFLFDKCKLNKTYLYTLCHQKDADAVLFSD